VLKKETTMNRLSTILTAGALAATFGLGTVQPAKADQQSTDVIIGAAALAAGIATYANVQHKNQLANTVQGYTPWGAAVYEDGHVVLPNGQSYYPGNVGQQIACNGSTCQILHNGIPVGYGAYGPGGGYNTGYNNGYYNNGGYNNGGYNNGYYNNNGYYSTARRPAGTYTVVHPAGYTTAQVVPAALTRRAATIPVVVRAPINAAHPAAIEHVRAVRAVQRDLGENR
jgi:hypothetical protein